MLTLVGFFNGLSLLPVNVKYVILPNERQSLVRRKGHEGEVTSGLRGDLPDSARKVCQREQQQRHQNIRNFQEGKSDRPLRHSGRDGDMHHTLQQGNVGSQSLEPCDFSHGFINVNPRYFMGH